MKYEPSKEEYLRYIRKITPGYNRPRNCMRAFLTGGSICASGELIRQVLIRGMGLDEKTAMSGVTLVLILLSVLATGFHFYTRIARFAGAGTLVPITGFANSIASAAIEYRKEGHVFGIGVKIFSIAGPVLLFGIVSSFLAGVIYWIFRLAGFAG